MCCYSRPTGSLVCSACECNRPADNFSHHQRRKPANARRCKRCVYRDLPTAAEVEAEMEEEEAFRATVETHRLFRENVLRTFRESCERGGGDGMIVHPHDTATHASILDAIVHALKSDSNKV